MTIPIFTAGTELTAAELNAALTDAAALPMTQANTWSEPQTFDAPIIQTPGAGANNSSPFAQYGDMWTDAIVTTPTPAFPTSTTLSSTAPALAAYVLGQRVAYAGGSYTVGASATSYLDLSNTGVLAVSTSATVTANSLRLATVTSSATAITGVVVTADSYPARKIISFSGYNNYRGQNTTKGLTLSTSTTGGTIAASTTLWYIIIPVFPGGGVGLPPYPFQAYTSPSITTGSTTATNSNGLTWSAVAGAISYNVYSNTVGSYYGAGLIGNTTALTFTDTGITPGAIIAGVWYNTAPTYLTALVGIVEDTASGYNPDTGLYTIPQTGRWLIEQRVYGSGGSSASSYIDYVFGDTSENNSPSVWTPAAGNWASLSKTRIAKYTQGQQIGFYSYFLSGQAYLAAVYVSMIYLGD